MDHRIFRSLAAFALGALPLAGLTPASAQSNTQFYSPPKVIRQGTSSSPTVKGTVTLKVFVKRDGSVGAITVKSSTNPADNAAALEIAKSSTYKAGARDAKPEDAYYTFVLRFTSSGAQADTGSAGLGQATALVRAGKYADAKTELQSYLTGHPGDKGAEALLGVADELANDAAGATAAFDVAGTIPETYRAVAAKAYGDAAVDALKAKNNDAAIALSDKGFALQPNNVNLLYVRGTAYANGGQYARAIPDFEQAKSLAASNKADAATLGALDASLVTAYLFGGQTDKGLALATDAKRRDPSNTRIDPALGAYYNAQAQTAIKAGNAAQAVSDLENGAKNVPAQAALLYTSAAEVLSTGAKTSDDWKKVKAESDKALAVNPNFARANYVGGIALANSGDSAGALLALQKAKANVGTDAELSARIDTALAQLAKK